MNRVPLAQTYRERSRHLESEENTGYWPRSDPGARRFRARRFRARSPRALLGSRVLSSRCSSLVVYTSSVMCRLQHFVGILVIGRQKWQRSQVAEKIAEPDSADGDGHDDVGNGNG